MRLFGSFWWWPLSLVHTSSVSRLLSMDWFRVWPQACGQFEWDWLVSGELCFTVTVACSCFCEACCSRVILLFRRLISEISRSIVTKLCHMFDGDPEFQIYKMRSEILVFSPNKFCDPQTSKFRWFRDLIANMCWTKQTEVGLRRRCDHWRCGAHRYFSLQTHRTDITLDITARRTF